LNVIEREVVRQAHLARRVLLNFQRARAFPKSQAAGTDLTGSWEETVLRKNDVEAY